MESIVKLSKQKLNELLYYVNLDNPEYGLIFRLLYVYGRNIHEVLKLRKIDVTHRHIVFNVNKDNVKFVLHSSVHDDLIQLIEKKYLTETDTIFIEHIYENIDIYTKRLNYYLNTIINKLNKTIYFKCPKITTNDFKILRGQHLYLDGADIYTIHKLYHNSNIQSTRTNIQEQKLKQIKYPCNNLDKIFEEYTELNIFKDIFYNHDDLYTICYDDKSCIVNYHLQKFEFLEGDSNVYTIFCDCDLNSIQKKLHLLDVGDLLLFGDFKILKY